MKKIWKPILYLILSAAAAAVSAVLYRIGGFSPVFALSLMIAAVVSGPLTAAFYRLCGLIATLGALAAIGAAIFALSGEAAGGLLIVTYAFSAPLVLAIGWRFLDNLRDLSFYALPAHGLIAFGGVVGYCFLHFGDWNPVRLTERVALRLAEQLEQLKPLYERFYGGPMPDVLEKQLQLSVESSAETAFTLVMTAAYLLMGAFFLCAWFGDRCGRAAGQKSRLGAWRALIPTPLPSYLYMAAYILVLLVADQTYWTWYAVFTLFGFFYVFCAVYRFRGFLRRKGMPEAVRILLCGLLLAIAWASSFSAGFSAYTILMFYGWWSATSRIMIRFRKE